MQNRFSSAASPNPASLSISLSISLPLADTRTSKYFSRKELSRRELIAHQSPSLEATTITPRDLRGRFAALSSCAPRKRRHNERRVQLAHECRLQRLPDQRGAALTIHSMAAYAAPTQFSPVMPHSSKMN